MNSFLCWTEKYQPIKARHIIGDKTTSKELFNWLCLWKEKHESIVKKLAAKAIKKYVFIFCLLKYPGVWWF